MQALLNTISLILAYTIISLWSAQATSLPDNFVLKVWARRIEEEIHKYNLIGYITYDDDCNLRLSDEKGARYFGPHGSKIYTAGTNVGVNPGGRLNVLDGKNDFDWKSLPTYELYQGAIIITPASGLSIIDCLPHGVDLGIGFFLRKEDDRTGCENRFLYKFLFEVKLVP